MTHSNTTRACASWQVVAGALATAFLAGCTAVHPLPDPRSDLPPESMSEEGIACADARLDRVVEYQSGAFTVTELQGFEGVQVIQQSALGCWLACAEMLLRFDSIEQSQEQLAMELLGPPDRTSTSEAAARPDSAPGTSAPSVSPETAMPARVTAGTRYQIMRALCPEIRSAGFDQIWPELEKQLVGAGLNPSLALNSSAIEEIALDSFAPKRTAPIWDLKQGHPAVVVLDHPSESSLSHAYVLIGAKYKPKTGFAAFGRNVLYWIGGEDSLINSTLARQLRGLSGSDFEVEELILIDPDPLDDEGLPTDEQRVTISMDEFKERVSYVLTRYDSMYILSSWSDLVTVGNQDD